MANKKSAPDKTRINIAIILIAFAWAITFAMTYPINTDYKDVVIEVEIENPRLSSITLKNSDGTAYPHTIFAAPYSASWLPTGTYKLSAESATTRVTKKIDEIDDGDSTTIKLMLRKVPLTENEIAIKLYEDNVQVQAMKIILPTEAGK